MRSDSFQYTAVAAAAAAAAAVVVVVVVVKASFARTEASQRTSWRFLLARCPEGL